MARYKATVLRTHLENGQYVEKGMNLEFVSMTPPWMTSGGEPVQQAFLRVYGVDLKKGLMCSPGFIEVVEIK